MFEKCGERFIIVALETVQLRQGMELIQSTGELRPQDKSKSVARLEK